MAEAKDKDKDRPDPKGEAAQTQANPNDGVDRMAAALEKFVRAVNPNAEPPHPPAPTETRKGGLSLVRGVYVDAHGNHLCDEDGYLPGSQEALECKYVIDMNAPPVEDDLTPVAVPRRIKRNGPQPAAVGPPQPGPNSVPTPPAL